MKSQETFKALLSDGSIEYVSAQSLYEARRYFLRNFCTDDVRQIHIVELEQTTNYNQR